MTRHDASSRQSTRIVTVCVLGRPLSRPDWNELRLDLLNAVVARLRERSEWGPLDAVLLPAGFLRLTDWFGPLEQPERLALLQESSVGRPLLRTARRLERSFPGCVLVVGLDTNKPVPTFRGDQLVAAMGAEGPILVTRKIFPADGDTHGRSRRPYLLFAHDADLASRSLTLRSGAPAIVSVCYDAFVWSELAIGPTAKRSAMRWLGDTWDPPRRPSRAELDTMFAQLSAGRRMKRPVHLAAVHAFEAPGTEGYWQRHGIAAASAALGGALTVAASHYAEWLPEPVTASPLASEGVGRTHLRAAQHRKGRARAPEAGFYVFEFDEPVALVRLFVTA